MGSDILALYLQTFSVFIPRLPVLGSALKIVFPVLRDLDVGCQTLSRLLEDVAQVTNKGKNKKYLFSKLVVHGDDDVIVNKLPFGNDAVPAELLGRGHIDVCKPSHGLDDPITLLVPHL
jgi:hypothetical protein